MDNRKGFIILLVVFCAVTVLSNMVTANYIEDKVNNNIRMEAENLRYQLNQIKNSTTYNSIVREEKSNEVMAPTELAKYLSIELDQVYNIIDDKKSEIPYVCIEGAYRFSKTAIDEWLSSRKSIIIKD